MKAAPSGIFSADNSTASPSGSVTSTLQVGFRIIPVTPDGFGLFGAFGA